MNALPDQLPRFGIDAYGFLGLLGGIRFMATDHIDSIVQNDWSRECRKLFFSPKQIFAIHLENVGQPLFDGLPILLGATPVIPIRWFSLVALLTESDRRGNRQEGEKSKELGRIFCSTNVEGHHSASGWHRSAPFGCTGVCPSETNVNKITKRPLREARQVLILSQLGD